MAEEIAEQSGKMEATLIVIEGQYAHLKIENGIEGEGSVIQWPLDKLPEEIQVGDSMTLSLNFDLSEERQKMIREQDKKEEKFQDMRKLLEDLVN